jgi:hypothetical protein
LISENKKTVERSNEGMGLLLRKVEREYLSLLKNRISLVSCGILIFQLIEIVAKFGSFTPC